MKFQVRRMSMVSWTFIALSIGSVSYLAFSALDYVAFYPALAQLQASTWKVSLQSGSSTSSALVLQVSVSNPSGSSAFTITNLVLTIFFTNSSSSSNSSYLLFAPGGLIANQDVTKKLAPHSTFNSTVIVTLNPSQTDSLSSFIRSNDGKVMALVTFDTQIITFLEPVAGRLPLESIDSLPLS
jgi:hypothetical protein